MTPKVLIVVRLVNLGDSRCQLMMADVVGHVLVVALYGVCFDPVALAVDLVRMEQYQP